jgi:hypothetical protein
MGSIGVSVSLSGLYYTKRRVDSCYCAIGSSFCELEIYCKLIHPPLFNLSSIYPMRYFSHNQLFSLIIL